MSRSNSNTHHQHGDPTRTNPHATIVKIAVAKLKEIEFAQDAFEELQLDSDTKHIVEAISARHGGEEVHSDIIAGKGNGVVALFHGPPGSGKTLTAESIAEYTKRPLITVTCGDFGIEATVSKVPCNGEWDE